MIEDNVRLARFSEGGYALLRIVAGLLFLCHGSQKLFGALGGEVAQDGLMRLGGAIEFGAGLLIAVGLFTRVAALLASGQMAVAYFMAHAPRGFWPIQNQGELAVVYCFLFLFVCAYGPRRYSLDALLRKPPPAPDVSAAHAALR
jgi:putative oxidoreductase